MYDDQKSYNNIVKNNSSKITINDAIMTVLEVLWELAMCHRHANWPWQLEKKTGKFIFGWCRTTVISSICKTINTVSNCTKK